MREFIPKASCILKQAGHTLPGQYTEREKQSALDRSVIISKLISDSLVLCCGMMN